MKKDFKTTLNNAVPLGGLGALISNTTPSKTNNLQRVINPEVVTRIFTDYLRNYKPQPKQQPKFTTK